MGNSIGKEKDAPKCEKCGNEIGARGIKDTIMGGRTSVCENGVRCINEKVDEKNNSECPVVTNIEETENVHKKYSNAGQPPKLKDISVKPKEENEEEEKVDWNIVIPKEPAKVKAEVGKETKEVEENPENSGETLDDKVVTEVDEFLVQGTVEDTVEVSDEGCLEEDSALPTVTENGETEECLILPEASVSQIDHEAELALEENLITDPSKDAIMRVVLHSVHDIVRDMDYIGEVDPYVELTANNIVLGKTSVKSDATTAVFEESFFIKTILDPKTIKLRFTLKDKDVLTDDDFVGFGYFDLGEETSTTNQKVHLKWKGAEIGYVLITVDYKEVIVVD